MTLCLAYASLGATPHPAGFCLHGPILPLLHNKVAAAQIGQTPYNETELLHPFFSSPIDLADRVLRRRPSTCKLSEAGFPRGAAAQLMTRRRITLNVNNPEMEESDMRLITLEVFPDMTVSALRSSIEAEGIPAPTQHLYHNGNLIVDDTKTIEELQIKDGDLLGLHIRDMRGNSAPSLSQQQSQQRRGPAPADPELIRLQILGDPRLRAEVDRANPPLAAAIDNPQRFAQIYRESQDQQEAARRARMREIEELNRDEFNPQNQARIEEIIRHQRVMENLQNAMEYNPEC